MPPSELTADLARRTAHCVLCSAVAVLICVLVAVAATNPAAAQESDRRTPRDHLGDDLAALGNDLFDAGPLLASDFADPFVVRDGLDLYLYATNTAGQNLPVMTTRFGLDLDAGGDAFPQLPTWAKPGWTWAPAVLERGGTWIVYSTMRHAASNLQCIGRAVATDPLGPFVDAGDGPFICPTEAGGAIDASPFLVDDVPWLLWKEDGNCCGLPTTIKVQRLSDDGMELVGSETELLRAERDWEHGLVEGPAMFVRGNEFVLLYSAGDWNTDGYAVGFANCEGPTGPCERIDETPWIASDESISGPGGQELFTDGLGRPWLIHHAWETGNVGYAEGGARQLYLERVDVMGGRPVRLGRRSNLMPWSLVAGAGLMLILSAIVWLRRRQR